MYPTKEIVQDVKKVVKRRKRLLLFTPILFALLSYGALRLIQPKYESSISILVQKEDTLDPITLYQMGGKVASEDRLKSFNEIIYSRSTMEILIDSLHLDKNIESEVQKQELVDDLRKNIQTDSRASDSFKITFFDTDPVRARDGVALLANHFIQTRMKLENKRNNETVEFFQSKLDELEDVVDKQHKKIVNTATDQMKKIPVDQTALQSRLQSIDKQLDDLDWRIAQEENKLKIIRNFLSQEGTEISIQPLYKLSLKEIPLGDNLGSLLSDFDMLRQKYTDSYPDVRSLRLRILELAKRIPPALESNLSTLRMQRRGLNSQRGKVIDDMEQAYVAAQRSHSQKSNYNVYQQLYNDMKVKLEQARMTRDIGNKASEQFMVLDPPVIAKEPSSPDRQVIIGAGLFIGLIVGWLLAGLAEALDTTIRSENDLQIEKPIIAYLTDG